MDEPIAVNAYAELFDEGRFLVLRVRRGVELEQGHVRICNALILQHMPVPRPVLIDARFMRAMTLGARKEAGAPELAERVAAMAVLVDGPISSAIGNFYMRYANNPFPTRMFRKEEAARAWLAQYGAPPSTRAAGQTTPGPSDHEP